MLVLLKIVTPAHPCAYLADRQAELEYSYVPFLQPVEYESRMNEGYRKFGAQLFRPVCQGCTECRPIRIPVEAFRPDRSQRRAWKRNRHFTIRQGKPMVDGRRLSLYHAYHASQSERKGWPEKEKDEVEYSLAFVHNPVPGVEITMWEGDRLRAVVLTEVTPNVVSGIYHYYDPELYPAGVGTFCMLHTIELARRLGKRWAYFGYYVAGCSSLAYKARFQPCEIMEPDGGWRPHGAAVAEIPAEL